MMAKARSALDPYGHPSGLSELFAAKRPEQQFQSTLPVEPSQMTGRCVVKSQTMSCLSSGDSGYPLRTGSFCPFDQNLVYRAASVAVSCALEPHWRAMQNHGERDIGKGASNRPDRAGRRPRIPTVDRCGQDGGEGAPGHLLVAWAILSIVGLVFQGLFWLGSVGRRISAAGSVSSRAVASRVACGLSRIIFACDADL